MEILDIVNEDGIPTGETIERTKAHQLGILHRTAHLWILRKKENHIQILLQKRSDNKDSFPGCYDISSAGHIPAGIDFVPSAIRELKEELGYEANQDDLIYCGTRKFEVKEMFYNQLFHDHQVTNVYMLWLDLEEEDFHLQKEEVSEVKWFDFDECYQNVKENKMNHCIFIEELDMVKRRIKDFML